MVIKLGKFSFFYDKCDLLQITMYVFLCNFSVNSTNISLKSAHRTGEILVYKNTFVFTMWRDVGEGDLHEALQGQEGQTRIDHQPQELTRFT